MKRSVAIHGSTPPFVRWTIRFACPLRTLDSENLADQTFRQLRGLRELSIGREQGRLFEGVCIHPDARSTETKLARGFVDREVLDAFGDAEVVDSCCQSCPANAMNEHRPGVWAGCYGLIPEQHEFDFETILRGQKKVTEPTQTGQMGERAGDHGREVVPAKEERQPGIVELLEEAFDQLCETDDAFFDVAAGLFPVTRPRWYGFWQSGKLESGQVKLLIRLLDQVFQNWESRNEESQNGGEANRESENDRDELPGHWIQFRSGLIACADHDLEMHVELMPAGHSDGLTWTVVPHCPDCKHEQQPKIKTIAGEEVWEKTRCPVCQRFGNPHGARRNKVLGLRPYALMERFMGQRKTVEFLERFEQWRDREINV